MRLLLRSGTGKFSFTKEFAGDNAIPRYAILSHTWGPDDEEVTFEDLIKGTGENKHGYRKIQFCGEQAWKDGLQYFWIDTCCINKANYAELKEAINSMFRWYQAATKCYVYLSDVSMTERKASEEVSGLPWETTFQGSRWFTRGWTLQELLAPTSVEFFSKEWKRLGDKQSLGQKIYEITRIPELALQGAPLSQFSVNERLSWKDGRHTKLDEDMAYSLLGIFGVYIPPIYGEGTGGAFKRLIDEISRLEKCMQDLLLTDPRDDKRRIEDTKGGLLEDSYRWILENSDFQRWRDDQQSRLLWIKGDPGKGKTMLLCGIINELEKSLSKTDILSYFFCQATDSRINHALAVLRGLLYLLLNQQPSLVLHVQKKHDHAGKALFEDANAWVALSEIFTSILQDPSLNSIYLIIDALDECVVDLPKLLDFINQKSSISPRIKWVVSSRNWPIIEKGVNKVKQKSSLCLELNENSVSAAVALYIQSKINWLVEKNEYDNNTRDAVQRYLSSNANGTFLWVALVCQELADISGWEAEEMLTAFPPGLDALYRQMMDQICNSKNSKLCKSILAVVSVVYRPITLDELASFVNMPPRSSGNYKVLAEIIGLCGSFLILRDCTISFVHQSAKDFLIEKASEDIFPSRIEDVHYTIFSQSLRVMSKTLQRDVYNLRAPGISITQVKPPNPDPLAAARYSCLYWGDHLINCDIGRNTINDLKDSGSVCNFLSTNCLYWLEALSLMKSLPDGIVMIIKLENWLLADESPDLHAFIYDTRRFAVYNRLVIEQAPLQLYCSALIFAPEKSIVRETFEKYIPPWIERKLRVEANWSAALQTLEGHSDRVSSVAFSPDGKQVASGSYDKTVRLWDAATGAALQTLKGHSDGVNSVAFSPDGKQVVSCSGSSDQTVRLWDAATGAALQTFKGQGGGFSSVAFSPDGKQVVSSSDKTVRLWDAATGAALQTVKGHSFGANSVAFSPDGKQVVSGSSDRTVRLWNAATGAALQTLKGHSDGANSVAFSPDGKQVVSGSYDKTVRLWDATTGATLQTLKGHSYGVNSVAFSPDGKQVVSSSYDKTVRFWDAATGAALQTLQGHSGGVNSVAFSPDGKQVVSGSYDKTVRLWDAGPGATLQTLEGHSDRVSSVAFSLDGKQVVSSSYDKTVRLWDAATGATLQTLKGHSGEVNSVAFSPDGKQVVSGSHDKTVRLWNAATGAALQTLKGHSGGVSSVAFSPDGKQVVSSSDKTVRLWNAATGAALQTLKGHSDFVSSVAFSPDGKQVVSSSYDKTVRLWDAATGAALQTLKGHSGGVSSVAFSPDAKQVVSGSHDKTVRLWDTATRAVLQTLKGHSDLVSSVAFSPDGKQVVSSSDDKTVRLWDAATGATLQTLEGRSGKVSSVTFSPDDKLLPTLLVSKDWVIEGGTKILWLFPDYRSPTCVAVWNQNLVLGYSIGRVSIIGFKEGSNFLL